MTDREQFLRKLSRREERRARRYRKALTNLRDRLDDICDEIDLLLSERFPND